MLRRLLFAYCSPQKNTILKVSCTLKESGDLKGTLECEERQLNNRLKQVNKQASQKTMHLFHALYGQLSPLNSFIAQLVGQLTGIKKTTASNALAALLFFRLNRMAYSCNSNGLIFY